MQTIRFSLRLLLRHPSSALAALLTLALGIGALTGIFTLIRATLLMGAPFAEPERLVRLIHRDNATGQDRKISYPDFVDYRSGLRGFEALAAIGQLRLTLLHPDGAESLIGEYVSRDYFALLGIEPTRGRLFAADETEPTAEVARQVLISERLWQRRLGGDPEALGRPLRTGRGEFTVIGILPASFRGITDTAEIWLPASASRLIYPGWVDDHARRWHRLVGRLAPGVARAAAEAEAENVTQGLATAAPARFADLETRVVPFDEAWRREVRPGLILLQAGAALLLLIAAVNVTLLLRVRVLDRRRELAVRRALGATRPALIGQLACEGLVLALLGGGAGYLLALWGTRLIAAASPLEMPSYVTLSPSGDQGGETLCGDAGSAVFALVVAASAGVLTGLASAARVDLAALRQSRAARSEGRLATLFVAGQIALSLILATQAILMTRSFVELRGADLGYRSEDRLAIEINPAGPRYAEAEKRHALVTALRERLAALPGVEASAIAAPNLPPRVFWPFEAVTEDDPEPARLELHRVTPDFFDFLGVPLREGRLFTDADRPEHEDVAVVSESVARRLWPRESALGRRIRAAGSAVDAPWIKVVGVVADVRYAGPRAERGDLDIYLSLTQSTARYMTLAVATRDAVGVVRGIRELVHELDAELPILVVSNLGERLAEERADVRFQMLLLGLFAASALLLAAVGIYGVVRHQTERRRREIGIRMALGARAEDVRRALVGEQAKRAVLGLVIGLVGSLGLGRLIESQLFGVGTIDPWSYGAAVALLAGTVLLAVDRPVRRAASTNPSVVLRDE